MIISAYFRKKSKITLENLANFLDNEIEMVFGDEAKTLCRGVSEQRVGFHGRDLLIDLVVAVLVMANAEDFFQGILDHVFG